VTVGPVRGRRLALELVEQLDSLFGLRHCGRRLPRRDHPSAYGQMGRCLSPCLGDLDPNLYRRRLDEVLSLFVDTRSERPLIAHVYGQMRVAAAEQRFERAEALRRRAGRLAMILDRLGGVLEATHARPRLLLAPHPSDGAVEAFWLVGGRLVDFGRLAGGADELVDRTERALRRAGRIGELGAHVPPTEVDEVRIIGTWLASHPDTPQLVLEPGSPDPGRLRELLAAAGQTGGRTNGVQSAKGRSTTTASTAPGPTVTWEPGGASRRTRASAIEPSAGESATLPSRPTTRSPSMISVPVAAGAESRIPDSRRLGLPR
jgi:hypothetical protein